MAKLSGIRMLFDDLEFKLPPAGIVGVIGPNGAGKTTLFRLLWAWSNRIRGHLKLGRP